MRGPRIHHRQIAVVIGGTADVHPDAFAPQARCGDVGAFKSFPGEFERQSLLRIEVIGLHLRQREELGIETLEVGQVPAAGAGFGDAFS